MGTEAAARNASGVNPRPEVGSEAATSSNRQPGSTTKVTSVNVVDFNVCAMARPVWAGLSRYVPSRMTVSMPVQSR